MERKTLLIILLNSVIISTECISPPTISPQFTSYIRPWLFGRELKHQLSALVFANLTDPEHPLIAEWDCNYNTTDAPNLFQVIINSVLDTNYFVDGTRCTIRKSTDAFIPFVAQSFVAAQYILGFNRDANKRFINEHESCPGHVDKKCQEWQVTLDDGTQLNVYFYNDTLYRIKVDEVETFALDFDFYSPQNPLTPEQFEPPGVVIDGCRSPFQEFE